jgi:phosphoribosyl 1,2-cyclic phosphodiesterase
VLRVCSLGSGSGGNGLVVEACEGTTSTRILIDNGFNLRQLERRLQRAGLTLDALDAVFVTHEHSDHVGGIAALWRRRRIDVYCTDGTARAAGFVGQQVAWHRVQAGDTVALGVLAVTAFAVPHDAGEPVQYVFTDGARRAGLLTDAGEASAEIVAALSNLHGLVLECNHDAQMLADGRYPPFLKQRIAGPVGHLSNEQAAGILQSIDRGSLNWIAAAHLSRQNNRPELARSALAGVMGCADGEVAVADQDEGLAWRTV